MRDPVLTPKTMHYLRKNIRNCPDPYEVAEGGHFLQEWGVDVATRAIAAWSAEA
jgi:pimeloyl-ACP methyl ester carboxylesterase